MHRPEGLDIGLSCCRSHRRSSRGRSYRLRRPQAGQQIINLETLYPTLSENGIYLVEHTHTSLWRGAFMDRADGQSLLNFGFGGCAELMDWTGRSTNFPALGNRQTAQALEAAASLFC